ncbi:hypothetical protein [Methylocucumis oryzae]|uniref:GspE/PulE/PilB domain-containing protein n=1 Tax=Methylocucumis oryzae TaxID=1632867 RepID=UPI000A47993A
MATIQKDFQTSGLIKLLVQDGLITESDAQLYCREAKQANISLITYLVANKYVDSKTLAAKASVEFGFPYFDLDAIDVKSVPVSLVSEKLIRKHHVLPLYTRGKTLFIAMSDPTNHQVVEDIKFQSLLRPEIILVDEQKLTIAIETALEAMDTSITDLLDADLDNLNTSGADDGAVEVNAEDEAPIVRYVNKLLLDAVKKRRFGYTYRNL